MKRILILALACAFIVCGGVQASVISDRMTFDSQMDILTDESRTEWIDSDNSLGFSVDDILFGFIRISNVNASGIGDQAIDEQIVLAFSGKISAGSGLGPFVIDPIADKTNTYDLRKMLGTADDATPGLLPSTAAVPDATYDKAIFAAISNPSEALADNPLNFTGTPLAQMNSFTLASGWGYEALGGFLAPDPDKDFFHALVDPLSGPGSVFGKEAGGFTILDHIWSPATTVFLPVTVKHTDNTTTTDHDVILKFPSTVFEEDLGVAPWDFRDQSTMHINATPEPGSVLIWLGMAGLVGLGVLRKRLRK